ncbi:c-type cytochrome [Sphingobacterium spiritivorum]|uniref:c-type cytochrome n=1 Tax=Sphingobacterium spiritivorum TaxID=258 RepID=UPI001F37DB5B|nr:cytochrome c [Sphingobacterium spiritivorum]
MKATSTLYLILYLMVSCIASCTSENSKSGIQKNQEETADKKEVQAPVHDYLREGNKGVGGVNHFDRKPFDAQLADQGNKLFIVKCTICHEVKEDKIGPALYGVTKKRTPEWILNMMLTPDQMLAQDPDAISLSQSYDGMMTNMGLNEQEAKSILEYLRQEDAK